MKYYFLARSRIFLPSVEPLSFTLCSSFFFLCKLPCPLNLHYPVLAQVVNFIVPRLYILYPATLSSQFSPPFNPQSDLKSTYFLDSSRSPLWLIAAAKGEGYVHSAPNFNQMWGSKAQGWCEQLSMPLCLIRQLGCFLLEWSNFSSWDQIEMIEVFLLWRIVFLSPKVEITQELSTFIIGQSDNHGHFWSVWYENGVYKLLQEPWRRSIFG